MNNYPIMPLVSNTTLTYITSPNPNRDGSGTMSVIFNSGTNGSVVDRLWVQLSPGSYSVGASASPNVVRIWVGSTSSNWYLFKEMDVYSTAINETGMALKRPFDLGFPLLLSSTQQLGATIAQQAYPNIDIYTISVEGYDY